MTPSEQADKLRKIVRCIRSSVLSYARLHFTPELAASFDRVMDPEDSADHLRVDLTCIKPGDPVALGHVLYMCRACINFIHAGKFDKVNRWIGFCQGVLWMTGVASIDESREINS